MHGWFSCEINDPYCTFIHCINHDVIIWFQYVVYRNVFGYVYIIMSMSMLE